MSNESQFVKWYLEADAAGKAAAAACDVVPMVVVGGVPGEQPKRYFVADGVCGFAWINVKPANSAFGRWLKREGIASKAYGGGLDIWVSDYQQSMQRKEAYARAAAEVLREKGINAYAASRMD